MIRKNKSADLTSARSILSKMVAMFLLLIIIPVSTIGFIATQTSAKNLTENAEHSLAAATKLTSDYFDGFIEKAENLTNQIIENKVLMGYADLDNTNNSEASVLEQEAVNSLNSINASTQDLEGRLLFNSGEILGHNLSAPIDMSKVMATDWYQKVKKAEGKPILINCSEGMEQAQADHNLLSMVSLYTDPLSGLDKGVVIVNIKNIPIYEILSSIDLGMGDSTYIITRESRVLAESSNINQEELAQRQFVKDVIARLSSSEGECFYSYEKGIKYLVSYKTSPKTGLIAVTVVPDASVTKGVKEIVKTTVYAGVLFVILAAFFGFIFSLRMSNSMKKLMSVMSKAESGDLTASLTMKRKDEIGQLVASFNKMIGKIRELVSQNKQAAEEVAHSSEKMTSISSDSSRIFSEISQAIVEVASGSSNQATEVETSVKSVTQLADKISSAVERTRIMEADAETMKELSGSGIIVIENLNKKTIETNEIAADVVREMARLNEYVKNINVITNVLRGIADQTNLLALNAAIEAARAGESGKGFAVVADEIRKLAEQSNNNTREIQKHIENVFKQSQSSVELVVKAETSFKEQSGMVEQTAEMFSEIKEKTSQLTENINNVYDMIMGMDSYKENVMSSMENISSVSQQVSASTQEVSASAQEQLVSMEQLDHMAKSLHELSGDLLKTIEKFKV